MPSGIRSYPLLFLLVPILLYSNGSAFGSDQQTAAVAQGLAYVQTTGQQWMSDRGCVSCHQVPSMIWSHEAARTAGNSVSVDKLFEWESWATEVVNFVKPHQKEDADEKATMASNIDTMSQLLLAIPRRDGAAWRKRFVDALVTEQKSDGSWRACGQLPNQRRPKLETTATTTLWTTLALAREGAEFDASSAIRFADRVKDPISTEYLATRLLVATTRDSEKVARLQEALLAQQNDDGGWGWRLGESSDALGTGYALYALALSEADRSRLDAARQYLLSTQASSGRWAVRSTKPSEQNEVTATASDWGTAWAVVALSSSAPAP